MTPPSESASFARVARVLAVLTRRSETWWRRGLVKGWIVSATTENRGLTYGLWGHYRGSGVRLPRTEILWRVESVQEGLEALATADLIPVEWCAPSTRRFLCPACPRETPRTLDDARPCEACGATVPASGEVEAWRAMPSTYAELLGWATLDPQDFRRYEELVAAAGRELLPGPLPRILWRFVGSWRVKTVAPRITGSPGVYADGARTNPTQSRYARWIGDFGEPDPPVPVHHGAVPALEALWREKVAVRSLHEGFWTEAEILNPFDGFEDRARWNYTVICEGLDLRRGPTPKGTP